MKSLATGRSVGGFFWAAVCCCWPGAFAARSVPVRTLPGSRLLDGRVTSTTVEHRTLLLHQFEDWLQGHCPEHDLESMSRSHPSYVAEWLKKYIVNLYDSARSLRDAGEVINAVSVRFDWLKGLLGGAWKAVSTWRMLEPHENNKPLPLQVLKALICTCLAWSWTDMAAMLLCRFFGLLRPSECLQLECGDLLLEPLGSESKHMFIRVQGAKTRFRTARLQSVKVDVGFVVDWVSGYVKHQVLGERLWKHSASNFRTKFARLMSTLGLPRTLFTPACL